MPNGGSADLDELHRLYARAIGEELVRWIGPKPDRPDGFYAMMRYQLGIAGDTPSFSSVVDVAPAALLCLHSCAAVGGAWRDAVRPAASILLLVNWFVVHEQIEEHGHIEGERATLWQRWGDPQAINAGDGMFPVAGRAILEIAGDARMAAALARELATVSLARTEGQHIELGAGDHEDAGPDELAHVVSLKDGALGGYSAWAGAVVGRADEDTARGLREFGAALATARGMWQRRGRATLSGGSSAPIDEVIARYLQNALSTLQATRIGIAGKQRLEAFARQLAPLDGPPLGSPGYREGDGSGDGEREEGAGSIE